MRPNKLIAVATVGAAMIAGVAFADDEATSLSYISYLERYATVLAADSKEGVDAVVNMPVITGDRVDTARGARVEIQLADGSTVWLDEFSTLDFDALAASRDNPAQRTVLYLQDGTLAIAIPATALGEGTTRLDFKGGTLFLSRPGLYRFDLRSGQLHVAAHQGLAELPAGVGSVLLRAGEEAVLDGGDNVQKATLAAQGDDFWSWVDDRRHPAPATRTAEVVGPEAAGRAAVLDSYGSWVYVDSYSTWAWRPSVAAGWSPYMYGRWGWTPVGWNWVSYEPWGWYPYHYGSWYLDASFGWLWCWDRVWGPAWVDWLYTPGYVGWCPRGYYDTWYYDHHHHDGHGPDGGQGGHHPGRWGDTYDISGRVRLHQVDPRPWNMVPADQFTNPRIDRVRVDARVVLRQSGDDAHGYVRSGPLITAPSGGDVERLFDRDLHGVPGERTTAGLGRILGRDELSPQDAPAPATLRAVRTADLVRAGMGSQGAGVGTQVSSRVWTRQSQPGVDLAGTPRQPRSMAGRPDGTAPAQPRDVPGAMTTGGSGELRGTTRLHGQPLPVEVPRSAAPAEQHAPAPERIRYESRPRDLQPAPSQPAPGQAAPGKPAPSREPGYSARIRSFDELYPRRSEGEADGAAWRERSWEVTTQNGVRTVRVYSGNSGAPAASTANRRDVTVETGRNRAYSYMARPQQGDWARGASGAYGGSTGRAYAAPSSGGYRSQPAAGYAPRSYSAPAQSAPHSSAPRSSGGTQHASPGPSRGSASASHPHGH